MGVQNKIEHQLPLPETIIALIQEEIKTLKQVMHNPFKQLQEDVDNLYPQ